MKSPSSKEKKIRRAIPASPRLRTSNKAANRELITRFEQKNQATLARIWGEEAVEASA